MTAKNDILGDDPWILDTHHPEAQNLLGWYFQRHTIMNSEWIDLFDASLWGHHGYYERSTDVRRPQFVVLPGHDIIASDHSLSSGSHAVWRIESPKIANLTNVEGMTASMWFWDKTSNGTDQYLFSRGDNFENGTMGIWRNSANALRIVVNATSGGDLFNSGGASYTSGVPNHICATYHTDKCELWLNGVKIDSFVATRTIPAVATGHSFVGGRNYSSRTCVDFHLWDLRIYEGVLPDTMIKRLADPMNIGPKRFLRSMPVKSIEGGGGGATGPWIKVEHKGDFTHRLGAV